MYPLSLGKLTFLLFRRGGEFRLGLSISKLGIKFDSLLEKASLGSDGGRERGENDGWGESDGRMT